MSYNFLDLKPLDVNDSDLVQVPWLKYYKEEFTKKQIVLHHTVSGDGIDGDLATWQTFKAHIATCVIIGRDGKINQLFPSKYWGYHIGLGVKTLEQSSIAVELDNWGGLIKKPDGKFYNVYEREVNVEMTHYPSLFRGYEYYESYTEKQLRSLGELMLLWHKNYKIPLTYNESMWDVSQEAINGKSGVWTHVSFRKPSDKQDCHPDPELKNLLKTVQNL